MKPPNPSHAKGGPPQLGPGARRFASVTLAALATLSVITLLMRNRSFGQRLVPALFLALFLLALRMRIDRRLLTALTALPCVLALFGVEACIDLRFPPPGSAATRRGQVFDARTKGEAILDMRRDGRTVVPELPPIVVLTSRAGADGSNAASRSLDDDLPKVDGAPTLALGGISRRTTLFCNEGGRYAIYDSDEHGFNNPTGIWPLGQLDVALLGDSYMQGACVPPELTVASHLRKKWPATLSLGMAGNGPLTELAGLREYLAELRPRAVVWFYCENDLPDLETEKRSDMLRHYADDRGFRQRLATRQSEIDAALDRVVARVDWSAGGWPPRLASLGISRETTPLFVQDLVMGTAYTTSAAVLRVERISASLNRVGDKPVRPDFDLFERVLREANADVSAWGGALYFAYLPNVAEIIEHRTNPLRSAVLERARAVGLPIIDIHAAAASHPNPSAMVYHHASHSNEEGYRFIADAVARELERR
jgi:hypothetical protein